MLASDDDNQAICPKHIVGAMCGAEELPEAEGERRLAPQCAELGSD